METRSKATQRSESGIESQIAQPERRGPPLSPSEVTIPRSARSPVRTIRSVRSTASAQLRKRTAELEAEQKLAELQRKEIAIEAELIRKRLAVQVSEIEAESEEGSDTEVNTTERVDRWLSTQDSTAFEARQDQPQPEPAAQDVTSFQNSANRESAVICEPSQNRDMRHRVERRRESEVISELRHDTRHRDVRPSDNSEAPREPAQNVDTRRRDVHYQDNEVIRESSQNRDTRHRVERRRESEVPFESSQNRDMRHRVERPRENEQSPIREVRNRDNVVRYEMSQNRDTRYRDNEVYHDHSPLRRSPSPSMRDPRYRDNRRRSGTPAARGIEQLAVALENIARVRPPPRQAGELPIFTGAAIEWLPFKAAMRDSTQLYKFSRTENIARLRTSLRGEAREAVAALLYTATDPEDIMKTLEQCFGRPEILVDQALHDIKRLPSPGLSPTDLNMFAVRLQNIVSVLTNIDQREYMYNPMLVRDVLAKLSPHIQTGWFNYAADNHNRGMPELITLSKFLMREADLAIRYSHATRSETQHQIRTQQPASASRFQQPVQLQPAINRQQPAYNRPPPTTNRPEPYYTKRCPCCGIEHHLKHCSFFKDKPMKERWDWAKKEGVCFRCLSTRHLSNNCQAQCNVKGCRRPHHELLHEDRPETVLQTEAVMSAATYNHVLLKICPVIVSGPRGEVHTHALLDEGSTVTIIDGALAKKIGAEGPVQPLHLQGVNNKKIEARSQEVRLEIRGISSGAKKHSLKARTMRNLTVHKQNIPESVFEMRHVKNIKDEIAHGEVTPLVLIGCDYWPLVISKQLRRGRHNQPAAVRTQLGWTLQGRLPRQPPAVVEKKERPDTTTERNSVNKPNITAANKTKGDKRAVATASRTNDTAKDSPTSIIETEAHKKQLRHGRGRRYTTKDEFTDSEHSGKNKMLSTKSNGHESNKKKVNPKLERAKLQDDKSNKTNEQPFGNITQDTGGDIADNRETTKIKSCSEEQALRGEHSETKDSEKSKRVSDSVNDMLTNKVKCKTKMNELK